MKKLFVFLALFVIPVAFMQTVYAVNADEKILTFDSQITITKQNKATVTETISYDLGATGHHGIYRDIPIDYHDNQDNYYLTAQHIGTTDEKGQSIQAATSEENGNYRIRLGDPDVGNLTGLHVYKINYELSPIITKKDGKPFLNLDIVGTGWPVPINTVKSQISLEDGAEFTNVQCFVGSQGSTTQCHDSADGSASTMFFTATGLNPYQGMSVNANVPDGYVSTYLQPNQKRPFQFPKISGEVWVLGLLFIPPAIALAIILSLQSYRTHSKRKKQTVVAQYEPPKTLTPAEIGHLEDDSSDMAEVTATLIDMAIRGYLKITQTEQTKTLGIFVSGGDYQLTALKSKAGLSPMETKLFEAFFSKGKEVKLDDLDKQAMASAIEAFGRATEKSLQEKGFYAKKGGILEKGLLTDAGAKEWALVDGFKLYLNVAEKDRLKFTDAPKKTPERFSKLLPYAIALGVEEQWAKQFEGINITESTSSWYSGSNMTTFSAASFVSDLNSGFSSAVESNSSVSSSGGSSGGGFGGGGGGSW